MNKTYSNIIPKEVLRIIQLDVLKELSKAIQTSFGPMGSNTIIDGGKSVFTEYTKDGHSIIKAIKYQRPIEQSIKMDCEMQTHNVATNYGDGTSATIILSNLIFKGIVDLENSDKYLPVDIITTFQSVVENLIQTIYTHKKECTIDDIYKIALISTNNDEFLANTITDIYKKYGMGVFISLNTTTDNETYIKEYDGMTINSGYADPSFINDINTVTANIRKPNIYVFKDPVDTYEMISFFDKIINDNIIEPYNKAAKIGKAPEPIPTVILAPKLSRDMSAYMDTVIQTMKSCKATQNSKPPFLLVTNITQYMILEDIAVMCGASPIGKFIDPKLQEEYIKQGIAPTLKTIHNFAGTADLVVSGTTKTKFVNPKHMYNKDGTYSEKFVELLTQLEGELTRAKEDGMDANTIGNLKRRIHSLKASMVELIIGGVSSLDRDARKALAEDAILACKSAAENGVGYGANFEGLRASYELNALYNNEASLRKIIATMIYNAYKETSKILYNSVMDLESTNNIIQQSLDIGLETNEIVGPYNIRTDSFDKSVLASIEADPIILTTISKIITLMATSKQYLISDPAFVNAYGKEFMDVTVLEEESQQLSL